MFRNEQNQLDNIRAADIQVDKDQANEFEKNVLELEYQRETVLNYGSKELQEAEVEYFSTSLRCETTLFYQPPIDTRVYRSIQSMARSLDGRLLALGNNTGEITVLDTQFLDNARVIAFYENANKKMKIRSLQLSADGYSKIVFVDGDGLCRVIQNVQNMFHTLKYRQQSLSEFRQIALRESKPEDYNLDIKPMDFVETQEIDWQYMSRAKSRFTDEKNLKISNCFFYPSFTLLGIQNTVMVCSVSGLILKLNTNKDLQTMTNERLSLYQYAFQRIISAKDTDFPPKLVNTLQIRSKKKPDNAKARK